MLLVDVTCHVTHKDSRNLNKNSVKTKKKDEVKLTSCTL